MTRTFAQLACVVFAVLPSLADARDPATALKACQKGNCVLVAGHRGGYANDKANEAPENSLANLRLAIQKGYDVYETDIQRTADGVFVIVHDPTLDRETNGTGAAADHTWPQLKSLKKRYRDGSLSDQSITTLRSLLTEGKGKILFKPDLKPGVIDQLKMTDAVFLRTAFKNAAFVKKRFDNGCPRVEMMFKVKNAAQVETVSKEFAPRTIQIDLLKDKALSKTQSEAIKCAKNMGMIVETHADGDQTRWQELAETGVGMFHTTKPDAMMKYLQDNGWRNAIPYAAGSPK